MSFEGRNLALMQPLQNMPYSHNACFHFIIRQAYLFKASLLRYLSQNSTRTVTTSQNHSSYNYWLNLIDHFLKSYGNCLLLLILFQLAMPHHLGSGGWRKLFCCNSQNQLQAASQTLWFPFLKTYVLLNYKVFKE